MEASSQLQSNCEDASRLELKIGTRSLGLLNGADVVGRSAGLGHRTGRCVLRVILIVNLLISDAHALSRDAYSSTTNAVTGDVAVGHHDREVRVRCGSAG